MYKILSEETDKSGMKVLNIDKSDLVELMEDYKGKGYYLSSITGIDMNMSVSTNGIMPRA